MQTPFDVLITFETQEQLDAFLANLPEGASVVPDEFDEEELTDELKHEAEVELSEAEEV